MSLFKVALLQQLPRKTLAENLALGLAYCRKAKAAGADLALFPEMWSNGYDIPENLAELEAQAISVESEFVTAFGKLAEELEMAIGITFLESYSPTPRNTLVVFDRHGQQALKYAKVHICDFGDECRLSAGDDFYVADLDTAAGVVKIGAMICYDREFPESARILMLKGAEIILVPNACPMGINRLAQLRARAFENMLGIATCNYPQGKPDCNGHSTAFDGVIYLTESTEERDCCILEAGEEAGIYLAEFDLELLRQYRQSEVHGNAYRRPKKYHALIGEKIEAPFIREDYRR